MDHYLSKSIYPTFTVTPTNLVPICKDCNFNKKNPIIDELISSPFHPYYDNIDDLEWLVATLQPRNKQIFAEYFVNKQIKDVNNSLYSVRSSSEIAENKLFWKNYYKSWGKDTFEIFLKDQLKSCEHIQKNTWKTALLRALIKDSSILNSI